MNITTYLKRTLVTHHSNHSQQDDNSKSSINEMGISNDVWMTSLVKLHYPQTRDNVHERRVCVEKQYNLGHAAVGFIALFNTEQWTGISITHANAPSNNRGTLAIPIQLVS